MARTTRRENGWEDTEDRDWPERQGPSRASSRARRPGRPFRKRDPKPASGEGKGLPLEGSDRPTGPVLITEREMDRF
jgi:hypothetical protein